MSQHKRNVRGMHQAIRKKRDETAKNIMKLLDEMSHKNQPISFSTIAKLGRVSKAWLYRHPFIRVKIEELRLQQAPLAQQTSDSKSAIIAALKNRIKKLELEKGELHKQLEVLYGELHRANK